MPADLDNYTLRKPPYGLAVLIVSVITILVGAYLLVGRDPLHSKARRTWKAAAIAEISRKVSEAIWLESEINRIKEQLEADPEAWFSENLVLSTNGEWIVCASRCAKEKPGIYDIFIGQASNGKWYYSTYHFCIGKLVLKMEEQPGSLGEFAQSYFLHEFDGQSDDCLNETWPRRN